MPDPGESTEETACIILHHRNLYDCLQIKQIQDMLHVVSPATIAISFGNGAVKDSISPVMGWRKISFHACSACLCIRSISGLYK